MTLARVWIANRPRSIFKPSKPLGQAGASAPAITRKLTLSDQISPSPEHFTAFLSAGEEADSCAREENWENEGGPMSSTHGRIISTPDGDFPYKVILSHHGSADTERSFPSMRAAEAYIRRNTPPPSARSTSRDAPNASTKGG
jgi:hypothetical protein